MEEAYQELEELRNKNDALKADNATLLAERNSDEPKPRSAAAPAVVYGNGDLKEAPAPDSSAALAELEQARQRIADLEVCLVSLV